MPFEISAPFSVTGLSLSLSLPLSAHDIRMCTLCPPNAAVCLLSEEQTGRWGFNKENFLVANFIREELKFAGQGFI